MQHPQQDPTTTPPAFLCECIPDPGTIRRPFITLTYAQSLDAKIAGPNGEQIMLSGPESMLMTHWMRSMHDAIMIGVRTAINDDPRLNVRLLGEQFHHLAPVPVILDPTLRLPPTARILQALRDPTTPHAKAPWIVCRNFTADPAAEAMRERARMLTAAGARIYEGAMTDGRFEWKYLRNILTGLGLRSVMIEGGARVIQDVLKAIDRKGEGGPTPLVDLVIVTVAPMLVPDGLAVSTAPKAGQALPRFNHVSTHVLGKDAVMVLKR